jgi:hypothetical protein
VLASFNVEEFGTERVARLELEEVAERMDGLRRITQLDETDAALGVASET